MIIILLLAYKRVDGLIGNIYIGLVVLYVHTCIYTFILFMRIFHMYVYYSWIEFRFPKKYIQMCTQETGGGGGWNNSNTAGQTVGHISNANIPVEHTIHRQPQTSINHDTINTNSVSNTDTLTASVQDTTVSMAMNNNHLITSQGDISYNIHNTVNNTVKHVKSV